MLRLPSSDSDSEPLGDALARILHRRNLIQPNARFGDLPTELCYLILAEVGKGIVGEYRSIFENGKWRRPQPYRDLCSCCLVSRDFGKLATSLLYSNLSLYSICWSSLSTGPVGPLKLVHSLEKYPHLRLYPRQVTISGASCHSITLAHSNRIDEELGRIVSLLPNVLAVECIAWRSPTGPTTILRGLAEGSAEWITQVRVQSSVDFGPPRPPMNIEVLARFPALERLSMNGTQVMAQDGTSATLLGCQLKHLELDLPAFPALPLLLPSAATSLRFLDLDLDSHDLRGSAITLPPAFTLAAFVNLSGATIRLGPIVGAQLLLQQLGELRSLHRLTLLPSRSEDWTSLVVSPAHLPPSLLLLDLSRIRPSLATTLALLRFEQLDGCTLAFPADLRELLSLEEELLLDQALVARRWRRGQGVRKLMRRKRYLKRALGVSEDESDWLSNDVTETATESEAPRQSSDSSDWLWWRSDPETELDTTDDDFSLVSHISDTSGPSKAASSPIISRFPSSPPRRTLSSFSLDSATSSFSSNSEHYLAIEVPDQLFDDAASSADESRDADDERDSDDESVEAEESQWEKDQAAAEECQEWSDDRERELMDAYEFESDSDW